MGMKEIIETHEFARWIDGLNDVKTALDLARNLERGTHDHPNENHHPPL